MIEDNTAAALDEYDKMFCNYDESCTTGARLGIAF